ncbi:Cro/Cl family transcriptional regulator [Rahnella sp. ChDrAdgB13]|uniref:Cro/Cl family transcriptional regulator n=1 Tax=Rahnella sp. ChDrAdgB13 TaxID=1850581 RepID=UPI001FCBDD99|nr:Cro/Cl family transcriptional regulator [Rahnella sp. ChDrAdgB13]
MYTFSEILRDVGLRVVAESTKRSLRQIYKWERNNTLPRSDYTGETNLALAISQVSNGKYTEAQILNAAMPGRKAYSAEKSDHA